MPCEFVKVTAIVELNTVITAVGTAFGAKLADGFGAFQRASLTNQGDPCKAGLLVKLPDGTCDVHPSPQGQKLLAGAVLAVTGGKF